MDDKHRLPQQPLVDREPTDEELVQLGRGVLKMSRLDRMLADKGINPYQMTEEERAKALANLADDLSR